MYIFCQWLMLVVLAVVGKVAFMVYNSGMADLTMSSAMQALVHGLPLDMATAAALTAPVWGLTLLSMAWKDMPLRRFAYPYMAVALFFFVLETMGDMVMYAHWKFKLDASIFGYMFCAGEVGSSVSPWYIISRVAALIVAEAAVGYIGYRFIPSRFSTKAAAKDKAGMLALLLAGVILLFPTKASPEAKAFHSEEIFFNHAAINPVRHFASSVILYLKPEERQFMLMPEEECDSIFHSIFPDETEDITDTLLCSQRPNILTLQLEGCGAPMIKTLGGFPDVTPELCQWMKQGVNFTNAWSTSFRTDRGTVSAISGYVSYPTTSLMLNDNCLGHLPSLARSLKENGYSTEYLYGGDPSVMNKEVYLRTMDFEQVLGVEDLDVAMEERDSWGANDSIFLNRLLRRMQQKPEGESWYVGCQTISSHEPWQVPYSRLDDEVLNAFAYTDHCVGQFLDSLSRTPLWDNLLVVIFADHSVTHGIELDNPQFFHMPLLMLGGAVRDRRNIETLISQGDIAATLLSQLGISHREYPWSRNIFSRNYTYPFIYSTYPSGILFKDEEGETMTDLMSGCVVNGNGGKEHEGRLRKINVMLQHTYCNLP